MGKSNSWKHKSVKKLSARKRGVFVPKDVVEVLAEAKRALDSDVCPKCGASPLAVDDKDCLFCYDCDWHYYFPKGWL